MRMRKRKIVNEDDESDDESNEQFDLTQILKKGGNQNVFHKNNHIYFRCDVTIKTVHELCDIIDEYNLEHDRMCASSLTAYIIPKPLYLHITTNGGDVIASFLAYDYIKNSKIPIYTVGEANVISAGSVIYMAGVKRYLTKSSYILIHQIRKVTNGSHCETLREVHDETENCVEHTNKIINIIVSGIRTEYEGKKLSSRLTKDKVQKFMLHDIYWNFDTCKNYGLIDGEYTNYSDRDKIDRNCLMSNKYV